VVVICTRNRPDELAITLRSVAEQSGAEERAVLVVDGSDEQEARRTAHVVTKSLDGKCPVQYYRYPEPPAQTRQRNAAVELLPDSIDIVHFIDDDVLLRPGYFDELTGVLARNSALLGAGGIIIESQNFPSSPSSSWAKRFFLLSARTPSRVLPSGRTTLPRPAEDDVYPAEWLSTCSSSYRLSVLKRHRFDPDVEGPSPTLHDLDFSFRVAQEGPLAIVSTATCIHRRSQSARRDFLSANRERVVRRYWFVTKNMDGPIHRLAFWWGVVGQFLARVFSSHPESASALRGLLKGIRVIWMRAHPLLRTDDTR
jgi:GT2 family glycosyltransferase